MDSIPVLVISGNESVKALERNTRVLGVQGFNSAQVARPMCKWSGRLFGTENLHDKLGTFHNEATTPRMGACWLDVPADVQRLPYALA
jgi:acetolactate synthase-1/2/3 large subunit